MTNFRRSRGLERFAPGAVLCAVVLAGALSWFSSPGTNAYTTLSGSYNSGADDSTANFSASGTMICPVCGSSFEAGTVSGYGLRNDPFGSGHVYMHDGLDIAAPEGTPIIAVADGIVTTARWSSEGYGNVVMIDHGNDTVSVYAHCKALFVAEDDTVCKGQIIATVGETGNTTGPHLHFEWRVAGVPMDPYYF